MARAYRSSLCAFAWLTRNSAATSLATTSVVSDAQSACSPNSANRTANNSPIASNRAAAARASARAADPSRAINARVRSLTSGLHLANRRARRAAASAPIIGSLIRRT